MSSMCGRGWCFAGSCSSATSAVASASVITHSSWPVIPFFDILRISALAVITGVHHRATATLRVPSTIYKRKTMILTQRPLQAAKLVL